MAQQIKLLKVYHTPTGKLRAQVQYAGSKHILKMDRLKSGKTSVSFISMPIGSTSFEVQEISIDQINTSVTIKLITPNEELVRVDFTNSQFI